jgi:hypothetical protein
VTVYTIAAGHASIYACNPCTCPVTPPKPDGVVFTAFVLKQRLPKVIWSSVACIMLHVSYAVSSKLSSAEVPASFHLLGALYFVVVTCHYHVAPCH